MFKVSVIIPIYNVEQYLRKCLDSVVKQTLKDIEIILVNDASPDHSDVIMREYEAAYSNIRCVYLKENRCLGGARNAGVEIATGEYITFLDSDDYLDLDYCEKMYNRIVATGSDFAYSSYKMVDENETVKSIRCTYPVEFDGNMTKEKKNGVITKGVFAWGKFYSRKLWNDLKLTFPEHLKYEDAPTIPIYILHANKCCYVWDAYYYYLVRNTSIMRTRNNGHQDAQITALLFEERMKKYGLHDEYKDAVEFFMIQRYYCVYLKRCVQMYDEVPYVSMFETKNEIEKKFPTYEKNPYFCTLTAEDRFRILMNGISPQACEVWEKKYKHYMDKDDSLYISMYKLFYNEKKRRLDKLLGSYKNIIIWGDKTKSRAFKQYLLQNYEHIEFILVDSEKELIERSKQESYALVGVNPSACLMLHHYKKRYLLKNDILNLEDYLFGYIEIKVG